jgi:predicted ArsR family transcriptional regulator
MDGKDASDAGIAVLGSLDDPVRHRLYRFVAARGQPVGRDEAATAAGIGRPLAAYHLDKLVDMGLLTASYQRPAGRGGPGAGRPAKVYARSGAEFAVSVPPRDYELAARLLAAAVESDETGTCQAALEGAARRLGASAGQHRAAARAGGDGGPEPVMTALAGHGFEPFRDPGGTIRLRNCPFRQLAADYPRVVCAMTLALVEGVVEGVVSGVLERDPGLALRAVLAPRPGCCCVAIDTGQPESDDDTGES